MAIGTKHGVNFKPVALRKRRQAECQWLKSLPHHLRPHRQLSRSITSVLLLVNASENQRPQQPAGMLQLHYMDHLIAVRMTRIEAGKWGWKWPPCFGNLEGCIGTSAGREQLG
jgi:hypothetical protein